MFIGQNTLALESFPVFSSTSDKVPSLPEHISCCVNKIFIKFHIRNRCEIELNNAIKRNDTGQIRRYYLLGADINTTYYKFGYTPLLVAVNCVAQKAVQELILLGANVNKPSNSRAKLTPLLLSIRKKSHISQSKVLNGIFNILLKSGANPNIPVIGGTTPLMEACLNRGIRCVKVLINYGVDLNLIDSNKNTALDIALKVHGETHSIVKILNDHGAVRANENFIPLHEYHPKIDPGHIFRSGFLLPDQALKSVNQHKGKESKIKKYDPKFPSLFRTIIRGKSNYILYYSNKFYHTGKGHLNRRSLPNYLGRGAQAKIKIAQNTKTGEFFAVKITDKPGPYEIEILRKMNYLVDHIKCDQKHYIIQKLHYGPTLQEYFEELLSLNNNTLVEYITKIIRNLLEQVDKLHNHGYLHRDIAPDNIMIEPNTLEITLIDFGHAIKEPNWMYKYVGNVTFKKNFPIAPELKNIPFGLCYSRQSDLFAIGMILKLLLKKVSQKKLNFIADETYCHLYDIHCKMTKTDPDKRGNIPEYLSFCRHYRW